MNFARPFAVGFLRSEPKKERKAKPLTPFSPAPLLPLWGCT